MRIAVFAYSFPAVSETFVSRQVSSLIELGHDVDVYAETPPPDGNIEHPEVRAHELKGRTFYVGPTIPDDVGYWEMINRI